MSPIIFGAPKFVYELLAVTGYTAVALLMVTGTQDLLVKKLFSRTQVATWTPR